MACLLDFIKSLLQLSSGLSRKRNAGDGRVSVVQDFGNRMYDTFPNVLVFPGICLMKSAMFFQMDKFTFDVFCKAHEKFFKLNKGGGIQNLIIANILYGAKFRAPRHMMPWSSG
jgi:hypothetical protein